MKDPVAHTLINGKRLLCNDMCTYACACAPVTVAHTLINGRQLLCHDMWT